jgi:peptidoglycan/xylan/chitin deacetylase (PgdA/CDA1 family)
MRKKEILLRLVRPFGGLAIARGLRRIASHELTILAYHRVLEMGPEERYPFDPELVSASPEEFAWQMAYVKKNFDVIRFDDVVAHLDGKVKLPRRPLIVTFDDGFDDNYRQAFPILKSQGLSAMFFVSTGYIGGTATFWFDELAHLMMRVPMGSIFLSEIGRSLPEADSVQSRRDATGEVLSAVKKLGETRRIEFLSGLRQAFGKYVDSSSASLSRPMSWDNILEMSRGGMEIGSHTVTHPILSTMQPEEQRAELRDSKARLERELGRSVNVIGYPVGTADAFDERVLAAVREAGYRLACSYMAGTNHLATMHPLTLRRQRIERVTTRTYFDGLLSLPELID